MSVPKILLIVNNSDLRGSGVGSIFLRDAIACYPAGHMACYATSPCPPQSAETSVLDCKVHIRHVPGSTRPGMAGFYDWKFQHQRLEPYAQEVEDLIRRESIDLVWSVLNSMTVIHLVHRVMHRTELPLVCTVWDAPEYFAINLRYGLISWKSIFQKFRWILQRAVRISVMSETARRVYQERYGVDSIPWKHGVREELWQQASRCSEDKADLKIGFAGSMYACEEWKAFLRALDQVQWFLAGKRVQLHTIGDFPRHLAEKYTQIVMHGPQTFDSTFQLLTSMDMAYLPYWLSDKYSHVVKTSFPSKLSTYVAAGLPVFFHGPKNSAPSEFLHTYPVGLECDSLKPANILTCLEQLAGDKAFLLQASEARRAALENELSHRAMRMRFAKLMGISTKELREISSC